MDKIALISGSPTLMLVWAITHLLQARRERKMQPRGAATEVRLSRSTRRVPTVA